MPPRPPYALQAWQVGLVVAWLCSIANAVMMVLNWRYRRTWRRLIGDLRQPALLRLEIRDNGPKLSVHLHAEGMPRIQGLAVIAAARLALDRAVAEQESGANELKMKASRHGS